MQIVMDYFKNRKMYELQDVSVDEDKISNLPDCILQHVLSFLPTKDAVATCILSTRWKDLWTFVRYIDFDDALLYYSEENGWYPLKMTCFMNFVERVLLLRHGSNMEKFRLSCRVCFNASRIHAWVSAAIKHKVEELDLCLFVETPFTLPRCVFDSESLTVVKIEMNCVLELPTCISFPQLKTLHLALVTFTDDDSTQKLLSSCPVLQDLAILDCEWMNLKRIMVSIPTLKSLTIDDLPYFGSGDELNGCEIKIDVANLIFFKYSGYLLNEIFLCNMSSLNSASIYVPILCERRKEIGYRAVKLLRGLHSVKSMRISNGAIESLFLADNMLDHLPIFHNLTYLELSIEIEKHIIQRLVNLLQYLPNLESLVFVKGVDPHVCFDEEDWIWNPVPKCFLTCLKSVSLHNFHGNYAEMCLLRSLLKNALFLERLNIFCSKNLSGDSKMQKEVVDRLQMFPRASTSCLIMFL
ncbi:F-box/LRR-repeat protein At4g14103-like isoform X2 [Actinidia eriantha]|nr:F-box/LRR-repeat protein At4g14103-like isoform X2 [Actinidia eriantha]XP_057465396.1 F-box/LRR-repeat protein At4g14103-like isoform X2 [Actinidia eriantha]XP_057465397.1 F-box/LRR-repeat protein At4g14103-like isoform X2 [Actinidia eriantha]